MSTKGITPRNWVGGLAAERREAEASLVKVKPKGARPVAGAADGVEKVPARLVDRLGVAGVPEKVAAKHGAALAGAAGDVAAIASFGSTKLEAWRGRSFTRIVEQFYKALGAALDAAPEASRPEVAKANVAALKALVSKVGTADQLGSAVSSAVALFELGVRETGRGVLTSTPKELPQAMADATAAVLALSEKLSARTGVSTALNIFPVLVEQLERTEAKLTPARRKELWAAIEGYLVDAGPKTGFTQDVGAELARTLGEAIAAPGDKADVLARATELFRAPFATAHQEVLDQLASRRVQGITVKSPGRPDFDVFNAALETMVKAHPAASDALNRGIFEARAAAVELLAYHDPRTQETNPWPAIATLVERLGPTARGAELLDWLTRLIPNTGDSGVARALVNAAAAEKPGELARRLAYVDFAFAGYSADQLDDRVKNLLGDVAKLGDDRALQWVFAQSKPHRESDEFLAESGTKMLELAKKGGRDDLSQALGQLGARMRDILPQLRYADLGGDDPFAQKNAIAAELARASSGTDDVANALWPATRLLQSVHQHFPRAPLSELVASQSSDKPGIWALVDPGVRYRHDTHNILERLATALSRTPVVRAAPEVQTDAARLVLRLTETLGKLDGEYEIPLQRIEQDLERAFARAGGLEYAPRDKKSHGIRRSDKPTVAEYIAAHPEYPLELAVTAGKHLSADQQTWLLDRLGKAVGRDSRRQLRDFVFACVTANKKPLIDVLAATEAPSKAVARTISFVARLYREDKLAEVPWPELLRGFRQNLDPIGAIEKKKIDASLAQLGLGNLGANLDEKGLEEIAKCGEAITYIMEHFQDGQHQDGMDMARFRGPFLDVLKSVASGTWPETRYDNEHGKRQMSIFTPAQQAIWREETVTSAGQGNRVDDPEQRRAAQLAKGLGKALKRDVKLTAPGLPELGWNKASLEKLEARHAELVDAVHGAEKGSAAHKTIGAELGQVRDALALLQLHYAIQNAGEQPAAALLSLKAPLDAAMPALRKQRIDGAYAAAVDISFAARDVKSSPRQGVYAVDEDRLEPLLTSTTGGCVHYTGFRRWALGSVAANANEKMLRVYDGDNFVYRAMMRFHGASFKGYDGPVIWLNMAMVNGGGNDVHQQLLLKHALAKGRALGIPVVSSYAELNEAARATGQQVREENVKLKIDGGHTDAIFTDYVLGSDVRTMQGQGKVREAELELKIVMPK